MEDFVEEIVDIFDSRFRMTKSRTSVEGVWRMVEIERIDPWDEAV